MSHVHLILAAAYQHGVSSMSAVQGLQQEVARRQMAVLDRTFASPDLPQTMHERQVSLRCGHTLQRWFGCAWRLSLYAVQK